jgi:hypothetical protein
MKNLRFVTLTACLVTLGGLSLQAQDVTGTGTKNYIPIWTSSSKIGDSVMFQSGSAVGVGTTSPAYPLDVTGEVNSSVGYMIGGTLMLATPGGATADNLAVGAALNLTVTGNTNTGVGRAALIGVSTGSGNTALGYEALASNTSGGFNTAVGAGAIDGNKSGEFNTAVGNSALQRVTGGSSNVAIGYEAGLNITNSNNIDIGNEGVAADSGVIRIGTSGTQTTFYAAGISGVTTALSGAVEVFVDSAGQLGTKSSSIRFKEDVHDMADASDGLLQLRPVTYRYKQPYADGSKPVDYGLIAEEVAQVYPDLVARDANGKIQTVQYSKLTPMLLNEVQKQHQVMEQQAETIRLLEQRLAALEAK